VHAYALPEPVNQTELQQALRAELGRVYPETADAKLVTEEWLVKNDCPLMDTGPWRLRPEVANHLLAGWGLRGHDIWSVPVQGRHRIVPLIRRLAAKTDRAAVYEAAGRGRDTLPVARVVSHFVVTARGLTDPAR
jgi:isorenieratene synthase